MIKFFRKIRQKLLSENKFSKYLIYAIGEIVLVIIGILIALNINNSNEIRKNEKKFLYNLEQVQNELKVNIETTKRGILYYEEVDSLFGSVMSDTLDISDFKTSDGYYLGNILVKGFTARLFNNSFQKLSTTTSNLDESFNFIISKLDSLYLIREKSLLDWNQRITSLRFENERELTKTQSWYYDYLWNDIITDDGITYFLSNPFYKNNIAEYYKLSRNHLKMIKEYRVLAIEAYKEVTDLLNLSKVVNLDSLGFVLNKNTLKCYVGNYRFGKGDVTQVILEEGILKQLTIQGQDSTKSEMYPLSSTKFFIIDEGINFKFDKKENCKTQSLTWKMLGGEYKFTKQ